MFEPAELLRDRVGYMHLVEIVDPDSVAANDMSRNADGGTVWRNLIENHRARGDIRVIADFERAEHLCTRAYHDIVADSRMAFAGILAGTAEGHALIYHNIVADNGGLADNDAGAVVDEKAPADGRRRVYLYPGFTRRPLRYPACEEEHPAAIAPIGSAVHSYSFKTRIEEEDFERASRGGVAPFEGAYILPEPIKHKYQLLELG